MYPPADRLIPDVTLIGYPFGWTGRAEHVRAVWRALEAAGIKSRLYNVGVFSSTDERLEVELLSQIVDQIPHGIRIYSLNGDEVPGVLEALETRQCGSLRSGYNIVFPAWELPRYPDVWAHELDRFDEVWTASPFADQSKRAAVTVPTLHMPNACEPHIRETIERSHFGIPADRFMVLFFFDVGSYTTRKNPWAVVEAFRQLVAARPFAAVQLVIKGTTNLQPKILFARTMACFSSSLTTGLLPVMADILERIPTRWAPPPSGSARRGENFLIPVDAKINSEAEVALHAIRFDDLMKALEATPTKARIVILDTCRNNPFAEVKKTIGRCLSMVNAVTPARRSARRRDRACARPARASCAACAGRHYGAPSD